MDENAFLIRFAESKRAAYGRVPFEEQNEEQKVFSAVWGLEAEVNNGGFDQYFRNYTGEMAEFTPEALRRTGAYACALIVERALRAVSPDPIPVDQTARQTLLTTETDERLEALDQEFYAYPDNLTHLLFEYVQRNLDSFAPG